MADARDVLARAIAENPLLWPWDAISEGSKDLLRREVEQLLSALAAAGLAVVPVEPTEEMLKAGADADWVGYYESRDGRSIMPLPEEERITGIAEWRAMYADEDTPDDHAPLEYRSPGIWPAMLAAAPKP